MYVKKEQINQRRALFYAQTTIKVACSTMEDETIKHRPWEFINQTLGERNSVELGEALDKTKINLSREKQ